jgi:uncharacterized protein
MAHYPTKIRELFIMTTPLEAFITSTQQWLEKAVIGLNLCPFAKPVHVSQGIRYCVSEARTIQNLSETLMEELSFLQKTDPAMCETTLLIHPYILTDFLDYNDYLSVADQILHKMKLEHDIQIASFHPHYRFEGSGTGDQDIENYTNRSPYPCLHLLRQASIERVTAAITDSSSIYERNIKTMQHLGHEGWERIAYSWKTTSASRP